MNTYRRNGSTESLLEKIQRIEAGIQKVIDDVQKLHQEKPRPENGFAKFLKPLIDRHQN